MGAVGEDQVGRCHICQQQTTIGYCAVCKHWFCEDCRRAYFRRGLAWVKQFIGLTEKEGCCGP